MLYLNKGQENTLVLNINNNSRQTFTSYDLVFTHIMSKEVKTYSVDVNNPTEFWENTRYCTITLDFTSDDDPYKSDIHLKYAPYKTNVKLDKTKYDLGLGHSFLERKKNMENFVTENSINQRFYNIIFFVTSLLTFGLGFVFFYDMFLHRHSYINRIRLQKYIKKVMLTNIKIRKIGGKRAFLTKKMPFSLIFMKKINTIN